MSFPVVWLMPDVPREHNDSRWRLTWAQAQIEEILTDVGGEHLVGFDELGDQSGAAVVVPAEYYGKPEQVAWLRTQLNNLDWAVVLITSDECSRFPVSQLQHRLERMRVWVQTPRPGQHGGTRFLPFGPPPDTRRLLGEVSELGQQRDYDWFFSGQVNHPRRRQLADVLSTMAGGKFNETAGFTKGFSRRKYLELTAQAKVVPCPSGPGTPDSFRVWEALEAGALPVADGLCPGHSAPGFWQQLFGGTTPPFPIVDQWDDIGGLVEVLQESWPANGNRAGAWWSHTQRELRRRIVADLNDVAGQQVTAVEQITVLIPTSPIPAHPDTAMIEETVASVRHHLPTAEILIMVDGVRPEQEHRRADYEDYQQRLLWLSRHQFGRCTVLRHEEHQHQANMTRHALTMVDTPLLMFVEHDTPLVTDMPIDWPGVTHALLSDQLDLIRFSHEAWVLDSHWYLMVDDAPQSVDGVPVIRTTQWSQRPHVSRADFYRRLLDDHFPPSGRTMIEDLAYSVVQRYPWRFHRLALYAPGPNMKRSLNLDGREDDPKYEMRFA